MSDLWSAAASGEKRKKRKEKSQYNRIQQTEEMSHNSTAGSILLEQENRAVQGCQCFFGVYVLFLHGSKNRLAMELSGSSRDWTGFKVPGVYDFNSGKPSESRNVDGVIDKTVIYTRQDGMPIMMVMYHILGKK